MQPVIWAAYFCFTSEVLIYPTLNGQPSMKQASPTRMKIGVTTVYFHGSKTPASSLGEYEEEKPPLMEVSLY